MDTACNVVQFLGNEEGRCDSCSTCQDLFFRDQPWSSFYVPNAEDGLRIWLTKVSYESLRLSSRRKCPYCEFLFQFAKKVVETQNICHDKSEFVTFELGWEWIGTRGGLDGSNLHVRMNYDSLKVNKVFHLYVTEGTESNWPHIYTGRHLSLYRGSAECVSVMQCWLSTCLESHPQCQSTSSSRLPDRVLRISRSLDVQLIENFDGKITGKYMALSHCWGGTVPMQLTSGTLNEFKQNIPFDHLPKTFQDALIICNALDAHYIWIDSLCILQDSREDWAMQGSKMAQIYSDCLVTIAADAAANSGQGFLRRVPDPDEFSVTFHNYNKIRAPAHNLKDPQDYEVHVRRDVEVSYLGSFPHHYAATPETTKEEQLGSHLSKRGWCFQESLLPNRVLHFAVDHLSWSCTTDSFCECMYGTMDPVVKRYRSLLAGGFEQGRIVDRAKMKEDWQNIIVEFTRRRLSFSSDRLAALAGLAARVHAEHPNLEYLAGLWSDTLPQSLFWEAESKCVRIQPYIAPSWSWSGITGPVGWPNEDYLNTVDQSKLKLVTANCSPAGANKYGALRRAELVVQGQLWRVKVLGVDTHWFDSVRILREDGTDSPYILPISGQWDVPGEIRALHEQDDSSEDSSCSQTSSFAEESDSELNDIADEEEKSSEEESSDEESSDDDGSPANKGLTEADGDFALLNVLGFVHFLILSRCEEAERPNTFQRIGITSAQLSNHRKSQGVYLPMMSHEAQALGTVKEITLV